MIRYSAHTDHLTVDQLHGFFVGWPNPPSPETHLRLLAKSDHVILAIDEASEQVVGFITAITDDVLFAYIPLLEVLPAYQGRGIGQELVERMLAELKGYYQIDLMTDPETQPFYARAGMRPAVGMTLKDFSRQAGR